MGNNNMVVINKSIHTILLYTTVKDMPKDIHSQ